MQTLFGGGLLSYLMARYGAEGMMAILAVTILAVLLLALLIKMVKRRNR